MLSVATLALSALRKDDKNQYQVSEMNLKEAAALHFSRLRFVLIEPFHPGNIGAVARAMKTMGFADLVVVNPHNSEFATNDEAVAFSCNAHDILSGARIVHSIDEALEGCNLAAALSARPRVFSPPVLTPRSLAERFANNSNLKVALVLGSERFGLPNEVIEKCNVTVNIPANPDYSSLNLAQSVQVLAYECRVAVIGDKPNDTEIGYQGQPASVVEVNGMFAHLEQALTEINFLNSNSPKKLMPRLKRLFSRAELEVEEVNILRGIAKQIMWKHEKNKK